MELDILLLTIYFICMGYVVYQMAQSIVVEQEDQIVLSLDSEGLQASVRDQLASQGIPEALGEVLAAAPPPLKPSPALKLTVPKRSPAAATAEFKSNGQAIVQVLPHGPHSRQPIKSLTVQVLNQTQTLQISVDWDRSSFTRMNNQTRRVIRQTPGFRQDLALPQVASVVNPNQFLNVAVTSEETFSRDPSTQVLQNTLPLIDLSQLLVLPPAVRVYALDLVIQLMPLAGRGGRTMTLLLPFRFRVESLPTQPSTPYLARLLKR